MRKVFFLVVAVGVGAYVASILTSTIGAMASEASDTGVVAMFILGLIAIGVVAAASYRLINPNKKKGTRKHA